MVAGREGVIFLGGVPSTTEPLDHFYSVLVTVLGAVQLIVSQGFEVREMRKRSRGAGAGMGLAVLEGLSRADDAQCKGFIGMH